MFARAVGGGGRRRGASHHAEAVLARLDPALAAPVVLSEEEFRQLVAFLRGGLQDPRATPHELRKLIPSRLPSGRAVTNFQ